MGQIFIQKNGTYYRYSMSFRTTTEAKREAQAWQNMGLKTIVRKTRPMQKQILYEPAPWSYDVYYSITKAQYRTLVGHTKAGTIAFSRKEQKPKKAKGARNIYELFGV